MLFCGTILFVSVPNAGKTDQAPDSVEESSMRLWHLLAIASVLVSTVPASAAFVPPSGGTSQDKVAPYYKGDDVTGPVDISYPDGTTVQAGEKFEKVWEVTNSGSVDWKGRYLKLVTDSPGLKAVVYTRIPDTAARNPCRIKVPHWATNVPGRVRLYFRQVQFVGGVRTDPRTKAILGGKEGEILMFPGKQGIWTDVVVQPPPKK